MQGSAWDRCPSCGSTASRGLNFGVNYGSRLLPFGVNPSAVGNKPDVGVRPPGLNCTRDDRAAAAASLFGLGAASNDCNAERRTGPTILRQRGSAAGPNAGVGTRAGNLPVAVRSPPPTRRARSVRHAARRSDRATSLVGFFLAGAAAGPVAGGGGGGGPGPGPGPGAGAGPVTGGGGPGAAA